MNNKINNKRMYHRHNLINSLVDVMIINNNNEMSIGRIKDVSKGGISFYSNFESLKGIHNNSVDIMFVFKDKTYILETEILREKKDSAYHSIHAGRFNGLASPMINHLCDLLDGYEVKEQEIVLV